MMIELKIPEVGESIQEVQIGRWLKNEGDSVERDEDVVELDTDKASMELPAPAAGVLAQILKHEGDIVSVGEVIAKIDDDGGGKKDKKKSRERKRGANDKPGKTSVTTKGESDQAEGVEPSDELGLLTHASGKSPMTDSPHEPGAGRAIVATPSARRALREHDLTVEDIPNSGTRIRRRDVLRYVEQREREDEEAENDDRRTADQARRPSPVSDGGLEEVVPMSLIRRRIAARLVEAQQKSALVTTFNEIDMSAVIELRTEYQERFQQSHGVKLGFLSFFVKAAIDALKKFPELNAEIRGDDIVYRNYYHVGIAIGSNKGLVVPVLRHAERLSFGEIEQVIDDYARRAGENKLTPDELEGGTFTISNGGIYGSLLSTPIVNPPQSGVLGMHAIEERPVARRGQVVIRPMMYVAVTYDHRIVDGREAVSFLRRLKDAIEEPARMLIEV